MTLEQITKAIAPLVAEWSVGAIVYDRITGKRGMIMGYQIVHPLLAQLRVDYGDGGLTSECPISLSTAKVSDGTDEDEWKDERETPA